MFTDFPNVYMSFVFFAGEHFASVSLVSSQILHNVSSKMSTK